MDAFVRNVVIGRNPPPAAGSGPTPRLASEGDAYEQFQGFIHAIRWTEVRLRRWRGP
jgi:hypothetical protein